MKNIIILLMLTVAFTSCEKTISLNYKSNQSKIVIEGNITDAPGPYYVKLTKSMPLGETGVNPTIDNAVVTISDDAGNSETLSAQGNGVYRTSTISGVVGRTYTLTVQAEGQTYTAQSTMPRKAQFDSVKIEKVKFIGDETEYNLIPVYHDPIEKGNNYRFELLVNNKLITNMHLVQNDLVYNGIVNTLRLEVDDDDLEFFPGDLITLRMQCVDKQVGLYYTTLALMNDGGPGGGTTPNNPPNNLSNGALGIFSAHTVEMKSTTIR